MHLALVRDLISHVRDGRVSRLLQSIGLGSFLLFTGCGEPPEHAAKRTPIHPSPHAGESEELMQQVYELTYTDHCRFEAEEVRYEEALAEYESAQSSAAAAEAKLNQWLNENPPPADPAPEAWQARHEELKRALDEARDAIPEAPEPPRPVISEEEALARLKSGTADSIVAAHAAAEAPASEAPAPEPNP